MKIEKTTLNSKRYTLNENLFIVAHKNLLSNDGTNYRVDSVDTVC